jgi:hypothetical protein
MELNSNSPRLALSEENTDGIAGDIQILGVVLAAIRLFNR